jgi:carotenoid cleavage dioxygenase-like enzyme
LLFQVRPFIENFKWKPKRGSTFYVIDRESGKLVKKVKTDAFFAFHHVNAFERDDQLIIDIDAYEDAEIIRSFYLERLQDKKNELPYGKMTRFTINMETGSIGKKVVSDTCIELPRIDYERFNMHPDYRYVYGVGIQEAQRQGFYNQIVKIDLSDGSAGTWNAPHCYPGEPVFVGRPGREAEDDGIIMSVVLDEKKGTSFLLILDAASFKETARAEIPQPVLFGYHGAFF